MTDVSKRIAEMSPEQLAAFMEKVARQKKVKRADSALEFTPRAAGQTRFPLSFEQQRLWFLHQLNPNGTAYNIANYLPMMGAPDLDAMRRALDLVTRRHEILRTTFTTVEGEACQEVHERMAIELPVQDLSDLSETDMLRRGADLVLEFASQPFDLARGPLLRSCVIVGPERFFWVFTYHHIVSDWWSARIFYGEVVAAYEAFCEGRDPAFADLAWQYADYAAAQRRHLTPQRLQKHIDYWRDALGEEPPVLSLPTDRPRTAESVNSIAAKVRKSLPKSLETRVRSFAKREGATLFMTMMAGLDALFHRYTGQTDIVIGSPTANRDRAEVQDVLGLFVNSLIFHANLDGEPGFRELLARVKRSCLEVYARQEMPFDQLVASLAPNRDLSRNPLFQVMFTVETDFSISDKVQEKNKVTKDFDTDAKFDLIVQVHELADQVRVDFEYNTGLFDTKTMHRWMDHYLRLLDAATREPETAIARLDMLGTADRDTLLRSWNDTGRPFPAEKPVHALFAERVALDGDAPAMVFDIASSTHHYSYAELDNAANVLARRLTEAGFDGKAPIGILAKAGPEFIAAQLAVLKAGGAYVPLDPEFPLERIHFMIEDTACPFVFTADAHRDQIEGTGTSALPLTLNDADWRTSTGFQNAENDAESTAYIMYTSGSTGRPKGVVISHRAINRLVFNTDTLAFHQGERVAHLANVAFDATTYEIWMPLLHGGVLVGLDRDEILDIDRFVARLAAHRVDRMFITTALFNRIARERPDAFATLKAVKFGGEACDPHSIRKVLETAPPGSLIHAYGPTECTTFSVMHPVTSVAPDAETVAIGRPIANTTCYVLDAHMQPQPIGAVGELYIGGPGLARGYLNRPELTEAAFVANPFAPEDADARLYRTGDLVRWNTDGDLVFVGRVDNQVKIRGFRIEPDEVTARLLEWDHIEEAVVVVRQDGASEKRLVAYVVAARDVDVDPAILRHRLAKSLPDYMIPSAFVLMDALPLGATGKIDRRALPAPDAEDLARAAQRTSARDDSERLACSLFAEMLDIETVGIEENFFALGGHSLLATRLISQLRERLGVEIPLRDFFYKPTPKALAERLAQQADATTAPPLVPVTRHEAMPLSFAQQRLWFLDRLEPGSNAYNMAETMHFHEEIDVSALERAFQRLVDRHESLRTRFENRDGEPVQIIRDTLAFSLPFSDFSEVAPDERDAQVGELLNEEGRAAFDLAEGPLLKARLYKFAEAEYLLFVNMHHIISDGWSMRIFTRELFAFYRAECEGDEPQLADLPVQYADYADWQRRFLSGANLERQMTYWTERLSGELPILELPTDRPRPATQRFEGAMLSRQVPGELAQALARLSREADVTMFMTLLTAFYSLLYRYTGQEDLIVGSPIANRNRAETEHIIGFFVNSLVLRTSLAGAPNFRELLQRVRDTTLGAFDHQDVPFEMLVDRLQTERDLSRNPLFQVLFDFHTDLDGSAASPTDGNARFEVEIDSAICDLSLSVFETGDGLLLGAQYGTALFDRATIEDLLDHFVTLLTHIVATPECPVNALSMLDEASVQRLRDGWNDTAKAYPADTPVSRLFEARAARTPDAVALVMDEAHMTYAQLNGRANRIARRLLELGAAPETTVAIYLDTGFDAICAVWGVLKSGARYLPLDPDYPVDRLQFMIADGDVKLLISDRALAEKLPHELPQLLLDRDELPSDETDLDLTPAAADAAYIIYTSGSTSRPKGVVIEHGALTNYATDAVDGLHLSEADRVLQFASLSFDVTVEEIFPTLLAGAALVLVEDLKTLDYAGFNELIERHGITGFELPTHYWSEWMATLESEGMDLPASLRYCIIGTERVKPERLAIWAAFDRQLFHVYGLTEATVTSLVYPFRDPQATFGEHFNLPIGVPQANTQAYVLDRDGQLLPPGIPGELYIGGDSLAREYYKRPELTAERFVANPFDGGTTRLYRTGDLVRRLRDGNLEFLGRMDHQLKIRGFRIEPAEIEAALMRHEAVAETVVVARPDKAGNKRLVAYIAPPEGQSAATVSALRGLLAEHLPEHMIPEAFVTMDKLPVTANGKLDRRNLPEPEGDRPHLTAEYLAPTSGLERNIASVWRQVLDVEEIGVHDNFFELGGNSMLIVQVHARLRKAIDREITLLELFNSPTVAKLAEFYSNQAGREAADKAMAFTTAADVYEDTHVAVIGMAGRFTGSHSLEHFWQNVLDGKETIKVFSDEELVAAGLDPAIIARPDFIPAKGVLDGADQFDAGLFGIPPREAELLDPQHRIFLEHAWMALERAGYDPEQFEGTIGVYAGASPNYYYRENLLHNPALAAMDMFKIEFGNYSDFLPERTSFLLNLRGPSVNIQSACSTSLTAVAEGYHGVLTGQCDMALAGGVTVLFPQTSGYFYHEAGIWSADGHVRSFDEKATGLVVGEGVGIAVLKRLDRALADGDNVYAVVRGAAIKNEGSAKVGFAAPGVEGQYQMVRHALEMARVDPRDIEMVEAHGSATKLGDPAEVGGLTRAYRCYTEDRQFCALGSVKSNIGHADIAAGVAGFLKTTLSLHHEVIPASLHYTTPNPGLELDKSPFFVPTENHPWPRRTDKPRIAGVSSLGVGGTNTHMILQEAPPVPDSDAHAGDQVLVLSARTPTALDKIAANLADWLETHPDANLADVAFTLQVGRRALGCRRSLVCADVVDAIAALRGRNKRRVFAGQLAPRQLNASPKVVFMFSGQGAQYPNMGRGLYDHLPVYRETVDRCLEHLRDLLDVDPRPLLFPEAHQEATAAEALNQTKYTQPLLFATAYAMAQQWLAWGVQPDEMIGHSMGEYVAATLAGVMTPAEALTLTVARGRLTQSLPDGAMTSVSMGERDLLPLLGEDISIAAVNSPHNCVVSGAPEAVAALEALLDDQFTDYRRLRISNAFHSVTMQPVREAFIAEVAKVDLKAPRLPYMSNLTGTRITARQATSPEYWADQMMSPVRFAQGIGEVLAGGPVCLLEVGPGRTLATLTRQQMDRKNPPTLLTSIRHPREEQADLNFLLSTLGRLWLAGLKPRWAQVHAGTRRRRVVLPTYPFERAKYFVDPPDWQALEAEHAPKPELFKNPDISQWFYIPSWCRTAHAPRLTLADPPQRWLLFLDHLGLASRMATALEKQGHEVIVVRAGSGFAETAHNAYTLDVRRAEDYAVLFEELAETDRCPDQIVLAWSLGDPERDQPMETRFAQAQNRGLFALLHIAKALDALNDERAARLTVLTNNVHQVTGKEALAAEQATVIGFSRVFPQEYGRFCRCIDITLPEKPARADHLARRLVADCAFPGEDTVIAYRGAYRYVEHYERVRLGKSQEQRTRLRQGGVYLMTGGLGYLGFELGMQLHQRYGAKLALVGHRPLPPRETWDRYLAEHDPENDKTAWKIKWMRRLEAAGAEVLELAADAADKTQMAHAIAKTQERFGALHGIFHAAGITDERHYHPIKETDLENLAFQFAPKVQGLLVLEELSRDLALDFVLNFSSIAALLGGLGFVGYSAANNFLDAYTHLLNKRDRTTHWLSVNWDGWLLEDLEEAARESQPDSLLALAQTLPEGMSVTARLLARPDLGQVAMSSGKLDLRIDKWVKLKSLQKAEEPRSEEPRSDASSSGAAHARPDLSNAYEEPSNEVESVIAGVWQDLLGVDRVGVHDNFFELGGDSLLSVHLSTRLNKALGVEMTGGSLLALQTVAEQAEAILTRLVEETDDEMLSEIFEQ
ncbi:Amino acid adenylation domain-containing protein [Sulfidibacter corallicola]|uniref:Amino acid adenylation domain-containing protein n=1 Tax=Sulfidibacter corallicola TaxID=2818388 RepID=A0A8A4TKR8_SULCO|nr:non-ribosomal peptide synthetase/type I polyketide synthase [Sulfidibacter corallicola]QTD50140.1 amino acid adenylation domain-containing protein [Sulfidibacter corallicola]